MPEPPYPGTTLNALARVVHLQQQHLQEASMPSITIDQTHHIIEDVVGLSDLRQMKRHLEYHNALWAGQSYLAAVISTYTAQLDREMPADPLTQRFTLATVLSDLYGIAGVEPPERIVAILG
jgi:hypothetical protein